MFQKTFENVRNVISYVLARGKNVYNQQRQNGHFPSMYLTKLIKLRNFVNE